jgi:hypothetical protein
MHWVEQHRILFIILDILEHEFAFLALVYICSGTMALVHNFD